MDSPPDQLSAWEPITPSGIAAFAHAPVRRLLLVQLCVAALFAVAISWSAMSALFPLLTAAIERLPERGAIRSGVLDWPAETPRLLAANRFLALTVNLHDDYLARTPAHLDLEFGFETCRVSFMAGQIRVPYPKGYVIAFNRTDLEPMWGAWQPFLLAGWLLLWVIGLLVTWAMLAALYAGPLWTAAFFANKELSLAASWRMAGAALMPGALVMTAAVLLYRFGVFDPVHFLSAVAAHFVLGWLCLVVAAMVVPRVADAPRRTNPFAHKPAKKKAGAGSGEAH